MHIFYDEYFYYMYLLCCMCCIQDTDEKEILDLNEVLLVKYRVN